jgi:hypothetical protein
MILPFFDKIEPPSLEVDVKWDTFLKYFFSFFEVFPPILAFELARSAQV